MYGPYNSYMTVKKLRELLARIDDDSYVLVNRVGNLVVNDTEGRYCGYIDFALEVIDMFDDDEEE